MLVRLRSRDGLERLALEPGATVGILKKRISEELHIPVSDQILSLHQELLMSKSPQSFTDMSDPSVPLSALGIAHGSVIFLYYRGERSIAGPSVMVPAGAFGKKMTMDDLIARQMRIERQEKAHCASLSFDRDAANTFQSYVSDSLAFSIKRGGFMYGTISEDKELSVHFIYEPPQQGSEEQLQLMRDPEEEKRVDAIAAGLGMQKIGLIFSQTVSEVKRGFTMSNAEIRLMAELQAESGLEWFATGVVKLEAEDAGPGNVHFEAFQMSDQCLKLWKDGWFVDEQQGDEKVSKMKKEVIVVGKDSFEVDNDLFLVPVSILDHQGPLSTTFQVENRVTPPTMDSLKQHFVQNKSRPFVKRVSDFHLLLFISHYFDLATDMPQIAEAVRTGAPVPEGYQLIIDSLAGS